MNAERLLTHYDRIADAPDAVPRLRRFILDLAVRGRLVSQDPNDEPAAELLTRISAERARLAEAGGIRPPIVAADPAEEAEPFPAPSGWSWVSFGRLIHHSDSGWSPRTENFERSGDNWGVLKVSAVSWDRFLPNENKQLLPGVSPKLGAQVHEGDFLISRANTSDLIAKCVLVDHEPRHLMLSDKIVRLRLTELCDARFVLLVNNGARHARTHYAENASGVSASMKNISRPVISELPLPLPPLPEQRRIVAKVDELMALCDRLEATRREREATRDRLASVSLARLNAPDGDEQTIATHARFALGNLASLTTRPDQIKQLRQTVLNLAVRGKLVPQDAKDEPASELLTRLRKAQVAASAREDLPARSPIAEFGREELRSDFPASWELTYFDEIFLIVSGVTKGQKISPNGAIDIPYLRVANVQRGHLDLTVVKTITVRKADKERYALRRGDILMTEGGDWDKLGRAAIWREEVAGCIHQNHVFRVRPPSNEILPEWVTAYVNSLAGRAFFENASKQTTNLASINMTQLRACPIPLPPLAEQRRIVAKVDELMALCDRLESSLATGDDTGRRLLDTLLAEAVAPVSEA